MNQMTFSTDWRTALWVATFLFFGHLALPNLGGHGLEIPLNALIWSILVLTISTAALKTRHIQISLRIGDRLLFLALCLLLVPGFFPMASIEGLLQLAGLVGGLCFLLALRIASPSNLLILLGISIFGLIQAVIVLLLTAGISIYPWTSEILVGARAFGVFQQPNVLASLMATSLACSFELLRNQGLVGGTSHKLLNVKTITWAALLTIAITTVVLVVTSSRTGWLGAILVTSIFLLIRWPDAKSRKIWSVIALLLGISLGFLVTNAFPELADMQARKAGLGSSRWTFYPQVLHLIRDTFPMGCGYGQFEICYVSNTAQRSLEIGPPFPALGHPHNEVMYWVAQAGIFGLAALAAIVGATFRILSFLTSTQRAIWIALLLPIALHLQLEFPFQHSAIHWLTFLAIFHIGQTIASANQDMPSICLTGKFTRIPAALALIVVLPLLLHTIFTNWVLWSVSKDFESNSKYLKYVGHPGLIRQKYEFELNKKLFLKGVYGEDVASARIFLDWVKNQLNKTPREQLFQAAIMAADFLGEKEMSEDFRDRLKMLFPQYIGDDRQI